MIPTGKAAAASDFLFSSVSAGAKAEIVEPRYMWQDTWQRSVEAWFGQPGRRSLGIFAWSTNQPDGSTMESGN
jgi:hypothetical protein